MSTNLEYLLELHRNGVITDDDLRKGIRILKKPSEAPTEVPSIQTENKRAKRNKKKKEKRLKKKYEQLQKAVIDELKQVLSRREKRKSVSELKLVDKPLCNYFKTYEIDAHTYKDPSALFSDKKSMLVNQISQDIRETMVSNSQLVSLYSFIMMKVMENESLLLAKIMENKVLFLTKIM